MKTIIKAIVNFFKRLFSRNQNSTSLNFSKFLKRIKQKAVLGSLIKVCPGGRHAWFESNIGDIRKPITRELFLKYGMDHVHNSSKWILSDNKTPLKVCSICHGLDGRKFWGELNEKYDREFPTATSLMS
jgi:hypothetical protein